MKKRALLIGNELYLNMDDIESVPNDIELLDCKLTQIGFSTSKYLNQDEEEMKAVISGFITTPPRDSINIIYFSGHGFQMNGINYILPVNYSESNKKGYNLQDIFENDYEGSDLLVIIDACRSRKVVEHCSYAETLNPEKRTYVAYATSYNDISEYDDYSYFTKAICENIMEPNISISELFQNVRHDMDRNGRFQEPVCIDKTNNKIILNDIVVTEDIDQKVYEFIEFYGDEYESRFGYVSGEYELFIDASIRFDLPLLEAYNMYDNISKKKYKVSKLEADIFKLIIFRIMKDNIDFEFDDMHNWYYKGRRFRIGEIPVLPSRMQQLKPKDKKGIEVNIECEISDYCLDIKNNLPNGFILLVKINKNISSQFIKVESDRVIVESKEPIQTAELSSVVPNCQPKEVQKIIGEQGRNLIGDFVKYDFINGNQICYKFNKSVN